MIAKTDKQSTLRLRYFKDIETNVRSKKKLATASSKRPQRRCTRVSHIVQNDSDDVADDNVPDDHRIDNIEPDSDHVDDIMDDPDDVDKQSTQRLCYFKDIQTDLIRKSNFKEFLICARAWENKVKSSRYKLPSRLSSVSGDLDVYAKELYPSDADFSLAPCSIFGDGNCLLRCGSMALYGNQDSHVEIRVRVALEMAVHRD